MVDKPDEFKNKFKNGLRKLSNLKILLEFEFEISSILGFEFDLDLNSNTSHQLIDPFSSSGLP
jgi:hypothetical protein